MQHFNAYGVLASGGIYHEPTVILKVVDSQGKVLQEWKPNPGARVLPAQVAYMISDILRPVGAALNIKRPYAAKTGTTENWHDSWLIGYSPDVVIGAWMGHTCAGGCPTNVNSNLNVVWGVEGAGLIFRDIFNAYEAGNPVRDFALPDGLKKVTVCRPVGCSRRPTAPARRSPIGLSPARRPPVRMTGTSRFGSAQPTGCWPLPTRRRSSSPSRPSWCTRPATRTT